jgi:hypothetical protein
VFTPVIPLPEIVLRGAVVYAGLVLLLRLIHKPQAGTLSVTDLLVVVLIAEASQNGLAGKSNVVPDSLQLVLVVVTASVCRAPPHRDPDATHGPGWIAPTRVFRQPPVRSHTTRPRVPPRR